MKGGKQRDIGYAYRLFIAGARAWDGRRLPLPYANGPGGKFTTDRTVARFLRRLNGAEIDAAPAFTDDANAAADRRLAAAGL
jgi:hypothetical protein